MTELERRGDYSVPKRKPRGERPGIELTEDPKDSSVTSTELPKNKHELEAHVATKALELCKAEEIRPYRQFEGVTRNEEADLDFTVSTPHGPAFLELTEFAPLHLFGGKYKNGPKSYQQGAMADLLVRVLARKLEKYPPEVAASTHLLVYTTDWRFVISPGVANIVGYGYHTTPPAFASILFFGLLGFQDALAFLLHPRPGTDFAAFDPKALRSRLILRPDYDKVEIDHEGRACVPMCWPAWRGP
jgi:hypothetical protein